VSGQRLIVRFVFLCSLVLLLLLRFWQAFDEGDCRGSAVHAAALVRPALTGEIGSALRVQFEAGSAEVPVLNVPGISEPEQDAGIRAENCAVWRSYSSGGETVS
jgi:hypothetical protein